MDPQAGWDMAISDDSTRCAVLDARTCHVSIFFIDGRAQKVPGTPTAVFDCNEYGGKASYICFVRRGAVDTLLVSTKSYKHSLNAGHGLLEISMCGSLVRQIPLPADRGSNYYGVSYTPHGDCVAVASRQSSYGDGHYKSGVHIFQYETGAVIRTIALYKQFLAGIAFSTDGTRLFLSHLSRSRRSRRMTTIRRSDGVFTQRLHVFMHDDMGCSVLQDGDGGVILACRHCSLEACTTFVHVNASGAVHRTALLPGVDVTSFAWLHGNLCCRTLGGEMRIVFSDEWAASLRAAWVTACVRV